VKQPSAATSQVAIDSDRNTATFAGRTIRITRTRARILIALARRPGAVVTYDALMEEVWPDETDCANANNLKTQVCYVRTAFSDAGFPACVETIWGNGYAGRHLSIKEAPGQIVMSSDQAAAIRRLLETHPNEKLADQVWSSLGSI